jgi:hypothetical protein
MAPQENISYRALLKYLREATSALEKEGQEDAAHYFEMLTTTVEEWRPGKDFIFKTKDLGL